MMKFLLPAVAGAATGVLTGAGVGGGTLLVLYLTAVAGLGQGEAQGINLLYFLATAPPALYYHLKNKRVAIKSGLWAAAAGCVFALLGAFLSQLTGENMLRKLFGCLWIFIGVKELFFAKKPSEDAKQ